MAAYYVGGIDLRNGKLNVDSGQVEFNDLPTITGVVPNLYISPTSGILYRING